MSEQLKPKDLLPLATDIVAAHVSHNTVAVADLPQLIRDVYGALALAGGAPPGGGGARRTAHAIWPEQYRERWGLPPDYPMVAPNYAKQRSRLAKEIGLGRQPRRRRAGGGPPGA